VARCVAVVVAVLDFVTVQLIPFPTRRQRATLEPDGVAIFALETTGDGSGGNVLVTIRADNNEFFYVLRSISPAASNTGAGDPGAAVVILNPAWIQDATAFTPVFQLEAYVDLVVTTTGVHRAIGRDIAGALQMAQHVPVGKVSPLTASTQDLALVNYILNVNSAVYRTMGVFFAYRKEALTVPGFLEALASPGLVR